MYQNTPYIPPRALKPTHNNIILKPANLPYKKFNGDNLSHQNTAKNNHIPAKYNLSNKKFTRHNLHATNLASDHSFPPKNNQSYEKRNKIRLLPFGLVIVVSYAIQKDHRCDTHC